MPNFICMTCGVQYGESEAPPQSCVICSEERQYIGWQGQQWTTLEELRRDHRSRIEPEGSGLTGIGIAFEDPRSIEWTPVAVGSIAFLALFGSVIAFVVYYRLLKVVPVSLLALVSYAFPIVAVALGWLVLDERLSGSTLAGAGMVLVGIALATWRRRPVGPPRVRIGR